MRDVHTYICTSRCHCNVNYKKHNDVLHHNNIIRQQDFKINAILHIFQVAPSAFVKKRGSSMVLFLANQILPDVHPFPILRLCADSQLSDGELWIMGDNPLPNDGYHNFLKLNQAACAICEIRCFGIFILTSTYFLKKK